ncbi:hypothetical protein F5884DRAFT_41636 [Xylogone sp. PMI_703]|nr:hypothetical protein F5884DRAFT_41636 [Xylogone sp. PMI_703]
MTSSHNDRPNQEGPPHGPGFTVKYGPSKFENSSNRAFENSSTSTTAAGHGSHPTHDNKDVSGVSLPGMRTGPQNDDLEGDKTRPYAEGEVMNAQKEKRHAGWGEEGSFTRDLDRMKREQQLMREEIESERTAGINVDGGAGNRLYNEGLDEA